MKVQTELSAATEVKETTAKNTLPQTDPDRYRELYLSCHRRRQKLGLLQSKFMKLGSKTEKMTHLVLDQVNTDQKLNICYFAGRFTEVSRFKKNKCCVQNQRMLHCDNTQKDDSTQLQVGSDLICTHIKQPYILSPLTGEL